MKVLKKLAIAAAALGITMGLAACDEEALKTELEIEDTTAVDSSAVTPADEFLNDALAKYTAIETSQTDLAEDMLKYGDVSKMDNQDEIDATLAALDRYDAATQVELLELPEGIHTSAETSASYFTTFKESQAKYSEQIRNGLTNGDANSILSALDTQDELLGSFGITVKSLMIAIEAK